jgi:hypothetical protein
VKAVLDGFADLFAWRVVEQDSLELEFLLASEDWLPPDPGVLVVTLTGYLPSADLENRLRTVQEEGVWAIAETPRTDGLLSLTLQTECDDHVVVGAGITVERVPLSRAHYAKIVERLSESLRRETVESRAHEKALAAVESYVAEQLSRAERILAEAPPCLAKARHTAEARARCLRGVQNAVRHAKERPDLNEQPGT